MSCDSEDGDAPPRDLMRDRFGGFPNVTLLQVPALGAEQFPSNWQSLGPTKVVDPGSGNAYEPSFGRINCVAVDPTALNNIFLGAADGGLWSSTNDGASWTPRTDNLAVLGVSSIVINPQNVAIMYLATGDADGGVTPSVGVYKSTDRGLTWSPTGLAFATTANKRIYRLAIDPNTPSRLYAATTDGIYITSDSGAVWNLVKPQGSTAGGFTYFDVKLRPGNPAVIYAVGNGTQFYRSTDGGGMWQAITTGSPTSSTRASLAVTPADPQAVYLLSTTNVLLGIYRSINGGSSFNPLPASTTLDNAFGSQGTYDQSLAVSPTNAAEIIVGGIIIARTTDTGASWQKIRGDETPFTFGKSITHVDVHGLEFAGARLYACTDGGLHRTSDGGAHWFDLSQTLSVSQIYSFSQTEQDSALYYTAQQDDGLNRPGTGMNAGKWEHVLVGDYAQSLIDPTNKNIVYSSSNGGVRKTTDGWQTSHTLSIPTPQNPKFPGAVMAMHPTNPQILFAGFRDIFKTTNGGDLWSEYSFFTGTATCRALTVAPSNPSFVYVSRSGGSGGPSLFRTTDDGATWTNITAGLPALTVAAIAIHATNPMRLWVALEGGQGQAVYASNDAGATWTNYSGSLPNYAAHAIVYEAGSQDGLYVGMSAGIYYRNASMTDWQPFLTNLPNAIVNDLQINYAAKKVRAATFGRGLWESNLANAASNQLLNISTRLQVGTGDNALIGGFILTGSGNKTVILRAIGPSLAGIVPGAMTNPTLELHDAAGSVIGTNDNWKTTQMGGVITSDQVAAIQASGVAPRNDAESAIIATLPPANYTAVLRGANNSTGIAVVEGYDLSQATAKLANISTRGFVQTGDGAMIGGFIIGNQTINVVVRAIGPSLSAANVPTPLANPTLELRDINGNLLNSNDNWKVRPDGTSQQAQIAATGVPPTNDLESALVHTVAPGNYTAIVRGVNNGVGNAVVEVYNLQ